VTCERMVSDTAYRDNQGHWIVCHKKCGKPAAERAIQGKLAWAKAILCDFHYAQAIKPDYVKPDPKDERQGDLF
jgi:hypothetical protein